MTPQLPKLPALKRAVREFREGILAGRPSARMCFMVCAPLQGLLSCSGIDTELIEGSVGDWDHVWLKLPDGRILDPTADQFGLPSVYVGARPANYLEYADAPTTPVGETS